MKKLLIITSVLYFWFLMSCVGTNVNIYITNNLDGQINKYQIESKDFYTLDDLPLNFSSDYVLDDVCLNGESILNDTFNLKDNDIISIHYGRKKDFFDIKSVDTIYIYCDDKINNKNNYVKATLSIKGKTFNLPKVPLEIRLRGNSTLWVAKKSYKLKFYDKQNLFNMGSDREWALLANYFDPTYMRNYYAYKLAIAMGMEYSCDCKFVNLFLNNQHMGLYLLCETVKESSARVDIEEDNDPLDNEVPFLFEMDQKMVQDDPNYFEKIDDEMFIIDNKKNNGKIYPFATKYPKSFKDLSISQYDYIKEFMRDVFISVKNGEYSKYIDLESFIDFYLIQELFMNVDYDYSSVYMYKPVGKKLHFGPVWDFDLSSGNVSYVDNYSPHNLMMNLNGGSYFFNSVFEDIKFREMFYERLEYVKEHILPAMFESIKSNYKILEYYAYLDNEIWNVLDDRNWARPEHLVSISYYEQVDYFQGFLEMHLAYLSDNFEI